MTVYEERKETEAPNTWVMLAVVSKASHDTTPTPEVVARYETNMQLPCLWPRCKGKRARSNNGKGRPYAFCAKHRRIVWTQKRERDNGKPTVCRHPRCDAKVHPDGSKGFRSYFCLKHRGLY